MARTARASAGNICYHVINRANGGAAVFRKQADYLRFTEMLSQACDRLPLRDAARIRNALLAALDRMVGHVVAALAGRVEAALPG